jgi:CMP-N-acetylneuraminic acid synthetase
MSLIDPSGIIGIIPARGGSEGVPRKNVRLVCGRPLLAYTIDACLQSRLLSEFFVSTEDNEIAETALKLGARVLMHPPELSTNEAPTIGAIRWDLETFIARDLKCSHIAVLRATSPFRTSHDIDEAIDLLLQKRHADSLVSVVEAAGIHPVRLKRIHENGLLVDAYEHEGYSPKRRQELEKLFVRNGAIYIAKKEVVESYGLWGTKCLPFIMPADRSININTEFDFLLADLLMTHLTGNNREC